VIFNRWELAETTSLGKLAEINSIVAYGSGRSWIGGLRCRDDAKWYIGKGEL